MTTNTSIAATTAANVRAEMGRQKVNYLALAAEAGIPASTLRRRIKDEDGQLTVDELHLISKALGKPAAMLMTPLSAGQES